VNCLKHIVDTAAVFFLAAVCALGPGCGTSGPPEAPGLFGRDGCRGRVPFPSGVVGKGVTIAILELACTHPDLRDTADRHVWYVDATEDHWDLKEFQARESSPETDHGIQVAAVAGSGGRFQGVAPCANLLIVKGDCETLGQPLTFASRLERTVRWVIEHKDEYGVRVLEMSGVPFDLDNTLRESQPWQASPLSRAIEEASEQGILVVWAAATGTVPPLNAPSTLAVGCALDGWEGAGSWKPLNLRPDWGRSVEGKGVPDLLAPGDFPVPLPPRVAPDLQIPVGQRWEDPVTGLRYRLRQGTSFSVPFVAGVAALCLEANPALSPVELRDILMGSADALPQFSPERQGHGMINPERAVALARRTRPAHPRTPAHQQPLLPRLVVEALGSQDPQDRARGLWNLLVSDPPDQEGARALVALLHTDDPAVLCGILTALGRFPALRPAWLGVSLGGHPNVHVRCAWTQAVTAAGGEEASRAIGRLLSDPDQHARMQAAILAELSKDPGLAPALVSAMGRERLHTITVFHALKRAAQAVTGKKFSYSQEIARQGFQNLEENLFRQWQGWLETRQGKGS
jgi:serine protease AprX